jgi:hypothetical protein
MPPRTAALIAGLRRIVAIETLPPAPPPAPPRCEPRSLLHLLLAPEPLPLAPPRPRRRTRWLAWLFLPERLDREGPDPEVR